MQIKQNMTKNASEINCPLEAVSLNPNTSGPASQKDSKLACYHTPTSYLPAVYFFLLLLISHLCVYYLRTNYVTSQILEGKKLSDTELAVS